jgi:esterase/lipase superfamily enzyme
LSITAVFLQAGHITLLLKNLCQTHLTSIHRLREMAVCCSLSLLVGCGKHFLLMPPPAYVSTEGYAQAATAYYDRIGASPEVEIFYATDRAPQTEGEHPCAYAAARGDVLRLGTARVVLGKPFWSMEQLTEKSLSGKKISVECTGINEFGPLYSTIPPTSAQGLEAYYSNQAEDPVRAPSKQFAERINRELAITDTEDVYILVTGLSTNFHLSIEHAASLHHYLGHGGLIIAYPWPTRPTPWAVNKDRLSGRISARALRQLIVFLGQETDARKINFIGYSAGAEVLSQALYQLRLAHYGVPAESLADELKIGQVILAAPDIDYTEFRNMMLDHLLDVADHFTIYVNADDNVLRYSSVFTTGEPRLGRPQDAVSDVEKVLYKNSEKLTFVDPSNGEEVLGESDSRGHSYWFENTWVSSDVMIALSTDLTPQERGLVRYSRQVAWGFPDDYAQRTEKLFTDLPKTGILNTPSSPLP